MTRLIDADALKKSFDEHVYLVHHGFNETEYGCTQYGIHQIIDEQPTIDAEPQWIPVSERLPDDNATVLITHKGGVSFGWYNGRYWERGANTKHRPLQTVTAWMPLPKPYEGKE